MKKYTYLSIILFAFDIFAFVLGMKPQVSPDYRHYYIDHTITMETYVRHMLTR